MKKITPVPCALCKEPPLVTDDEIKCVNEKCEVNLQVSFEKVGRVKDLCTEHYKLLNIAAWDLINNSVREENKND